MSPLPENIKRRLRELVAQSLCSTLNDEETVHLEKILQSGTPARHYYTELIGLYVDLADIVRCPTADVPDVAGKKSVFAQVGSRPVVNVVATLLSMAAGLALVLLGPWTWEPKGPEIATLTAGIDIEASRPFPTQPGDRLRLGAGPLSLSSGWAHIRTDQGVDVTLEGPSRFELTGPNTLSLDAGRLFVRVTEGGRGFTVETADARMVDLGTAFGVVAGPDETELHVMSGRVTLFVSTDQAPSTTMEVTAGVAKRITGRSGIEDLLWMPHGFVRRIDAASQLTWRGEDSIDLADIVAGGNGLGTGRDRYEIDPHSGAFRAIENPFQDRQGDHTYHPVTALPFVDGVFVPDGGTGPVQVSSTGNLFTDCPNTSNIFFSEVLACSTTHKGPIEGQPRRMVLNGQTYGEDDRAGIFMHANLGLTFDLDALRTALGPQVAITDFDALVGITEEVNHPNVGDLDAWILLDGRVVQSRRNIRVGRVRSLSVSIPTDARYLTLVVTDSQTQRPGFIDTMADWCVFGQPRLILSGSEE